MKKDEAREIGLNYINEELNGNKLTITDYLFDHGDVYVTYINSKEYLKTKDFSKSLVGLGPLVIDKENRYSLLFGSGYSEKNAILKYRKIKSFLQDIKKKYSEFDLKKTYSITIQRIFRTEILSDLIIRLRFHYVIPKVEGDTIWRVPTYYNKIILNKRYKELPIEFNAISSLDILEFYEHTIETKICEYEIIEYKNKEFEWNVNRAKEQDYEIKW